MDLILPAVWFFILGTAMGSFYNVLADRLPEGRDVVSSRSCCPDCGTPLKWYDLIPVVSFIAVRGRCRYCGAKLSFWYVGSEVTVGALFAFSFFLYAESGNLLTLIGSLLLWSLLFIVAVIDFKTGMIMDVFPILIALTGVIVGFLSSRSILEILLGGAVGAAAFGALYLLSKLILKREGIGLGDVFLLSAIGFWLPWRQVVVTAFLTAYVSLVFIIVKVFKEKKIEIEAEFPLGPSIAIAAFVMSVSGEKVVSLIERIIMP